MNLYNLTNEWLKILSMTDDEDIDEETINDTLETLELEIGEKAENYSRLIFATEDDILVLENRLKEIANKISRKKKLIERLKDNLLTNMNKMEMKEIKTQNGSVKIVANGGLKPITIDEENVPIDYMKQTFSIDKAKIREELEKGKELTFATMNERGSHIVIK